jgi:hypothetical protein
METIPRDVTEAVRAAAGTVPGYRGSLDGVRRRARRRRNRQVAFSTAAVVAVLAAAGIGVTVQRERPAPYLPALPGQAGDRLILDRASGTYLTARGGTVELNSSGGLIGELLPGGELVTHRAAGGSACPSVTTLPESGFAAVCLSDVNPRVPSSDVPLPSGSPSAMRPSFGSSSGSPPAVAFTLVVTGADGAARLRRELRGDGQVDLLRATATTAYLWRPAGLVAHDLATGAEEPVIAAGKLGVTGVFDGSIRAADLAGDRLAVATARDGCAVTILAGGRELTRLSLDARDCGSITGVRLSPDGSAVAVVSRVATTTIQLPDGSPGPLLGIDVLRIADGAVLARGSAAAVDSRGTGAGGGPAPDPEVSLAWRDDHTVHGVAYRTGAGDRPNALHEFSVSW